MSVSCWVLSSVGVGHTLTKPADGVLESRPAVLISPACVFELINTGISNHYLFHNLTHRSKFCFQLHHRSRRYLQNSWHQTTLWTAVWKESRIWPYGSVQCKHAWNHRRDSASPRTCHKLGKDTLPSNKSLLTVFSVKVCYLASPFTKTYTCAFSLCLFSC